MCGCWRSQNETIDSIIVAKNKIKCILRSLLLCAEPGLWVSLSWVAVAICPICAHNNGHRVHLSLRSLSDHGHTWNIIIIIISSAVCMQCSTGVVRVLHTRRIRKVTLYYKLQDPHAYFSFLWIYNRKRPMSLNLYKKSVSTSDRRAFTHSLTQYKQHLIILLFVPSLCLWSPMREAHLEKKICHKRAN